MSKFLKDGKTLCLGSDRAYCKGGSKYLKDASQRFEPMVLATALCKLDKIQAIIEFKGTTYFEMEVTKDRFSIFIVLLDLVISLALLRFLYVLDD